MPTKRKPKPYNGLGDKVSSTNFDLKAIETILLSNKQNIELGAEYGVSPTTISNIRHGKSFSTILTHIPRRQHLQAVNGHDVRCTSCEHFCRAKTYENILDGRLPEEITVCRLGIPEFRGERQCRNHHAWAKFCSCYLPASNVQETSKVDGQN